MKTKRVFIICLLVICVAIIAFLWMNNKALREFNTILENYNTQLTSTSRTHEFRSVEIESIGSLLPDSMVLIDESENRVSISNVLGEGKTLIFRYSSLQCNSCVDSQMEIMRDVLKNKEYNIIFLACYNNPRDLIVFKKSHSIDYPVYRLIDCSLPLPVDAINEPYFFVLDKEMTPEYLFIPHKSFPQLSIDYLNNIVKFLEK